MSIWNWIKRLLHRKLDARDWGEVWVRIPDRRDK